VIPQPPVKQTTWRSCNTAGIPVPPRSERREARLQSKPRKQSTKIRA
jgi:hypothetical protein